LGGVSSFSSSTLLTALSLSKGLTCCSALIYRWRSSFIERPLARLGIPARTSILSIEDKNLRIICQVTIIKNRCFKRSASSGLLTDKTRLVPMSSERILVVDDELFVRELLLEFLSTQGYEVSLADSGEKAMELLQTQPADVVLLDLKMPGMDGVETLKQIRKISPGTLAIIMTGYPTIESSIEALRNGACDYVMKPFKLNDLKSSIEHALQEHKLKADISTLKERIAELEGELEKFSGLKNKA